LKPDAYRRVEGRLPSPCIQGSLQKPLWFQQHGMAPLFSPRCFPKKAEKFTAVYLVRSLRTYARIRSLTTGTFNLVVKDRTAIRQSGAYSVQANPHKCGSDCPRNLTTIPCGVNPVNNRNPQNFHPFSTSGNGPGCDPGKLNQPKPCFVKALSFRAGKAREEPAS